jgi:hypothetical protein
MLKHMLNYAPDLVRRTRTERGLDRLGQYLTETASRPDQGWTAEPAEMAGPATEAPADTTSEHEEQQ